jgi:hypothetical protein
MMFETLVIDNFLDENQQIIVRDNLLSRAKWNLVNDMSLKDDAYPSYGFVHLFNHPEQGILSEFYEAVVDLFIPKINLAANIEVRDVYYTRSFLQVPLEKKFYKDRNTVHVDVPIKHIAAVYYVTDSDGDTVIYENKIGEDVKDLIRHKTVTPKSGRLVMFDGSRFHCSSQPKKSLRCIINFDLVV